MPELRICERRVIIVSDKKSQTVNICTVTGQEGVYDWIVRLPIAVPVANEARKVIPASIEDFVGWLKQTLLGTIERIPPSCDSLLGEDRRDGADPETPLGQQIMGASHRKINQIVSEFLHHPFLYRSEYNLHCELYEYLCRTLEPRYHHLACGDRVQLIQKEWPESHWNCRLGNFDVSELWPTTVSGVGPCRYKQRGLYDVAVLSAQAVETCKDVQTFLSGILQPLAVFEFGLNENYDHLRSDLAKLINNRIRYGCVIHLVRPGAKMDNYNAIEVLVEKAYRFSHVQSAYARIENTHNGPKYHYKLADSPFVVHSDVPPSTDE
jgi:hypothetical protein